MSQEGVMSDDRDNTSKNPASKIAAQASENTQWGMQTMKEMGRAAQDTGRQTMQGTGKAAQDMGRRTTQAGAGRHGRFGRMFGDMKFPMMPDMDAFLAAHRRNMETLAGANRVALEGAQTVAKRHMEIVQQTMQEMSETIRELASPDSPQVRAAKQAELIKHAYERAVSNMKELADLIRALQRRGARDAEPALHRGDGRSQGDGREGEPEVGLSARMDEHPDVVIVGGGVIGSAVAYFLRRDGGCRVTVIERDPTYARASSALSCSSIRQHSPAP